MNQYDLKLSPMGNSIEPWPNEAEVNSLNPHPIFLVWTCKKKLFEIIVKLQTCNIMYKIYYKLLHIYDILMYDIIIINFKFNR
jgi:hypothetical protein